MQYWADILARPCHWANRLGGWLLFALAMVIGYDVVGRKFFDTGSVVLQDLEWHLHGAALLFGFGHAYLRDAHVRVDLVREHFSPVAKLRLEIAGIMIFMIPYLSALTVFGIDYAARAYVSGEGSASGGGLSHRWIIKSVLPIGLALTVLSAVSVLLRCLCQLRDLSGRIGPIHQGENL